MRCMVSFCHTPLHDISTSELLKQPMSQNKPFSYGGQVFCPRDGKAKMPKIYWWCQNFLTPPSLQRGRCLWQCWVPPGHFPCPLNLLKLSPKCSDCITISLRWRERDRGEGHGNNNRWWGDGVESFHHWIILWTVSCSLKSLQVIEPQNRWLAMAIFWILLKTRVLLPCKVLLVVNHTGFNSDKRKL